MFLEVSSGVWNLLFPIESYCNNEAQINLKFVINTRKKEIIEPILPLLIGNSYICIEIW